MASAAQSRRPILIEVIFWVVEIAAGLALMPVLLVFTLGGLLFNMLRSFFISFVLIVVVVVAALALLAPEIQT